MAFTLRDLEALLSLLRQHPEWRDAVRREVLSEELLGLPSLVVRLAEGQERLTARMEELTARVDRLAVQMAELTRVVSRLDGRVGNLEGWQYQQRFNARGRVTAILRRPVAVELAELDAVLDARDDERLTADEWKQLLALDFLFHGREGRASDAPERFVALEISKVVDSRDVQRAHDRARILDRLGLPTIAAVGGSRLTRDAALMADQLGVRTLVGEPDDEA